jgi:hypothetical protein
MNGADADALEAMAAQMIAAADQFDRTSKGLRGGLYNIVWKGRFSDEFRLRFDRKHVPSLQTSSGFLRDSAAGLRENARQQSEASGRGGVSTGGLRVTSGPNSGPIQGSSPLLQGSSPTLQGGPSVLQGVGTVAIGGAGLRVDGGNADGPQGPVVAQSTETYAVTTDAEVPFLGGSDKSTVTMTRQSDGSYTVEISSDVEASAGISVRQLLKSAGIDQDVVDLGLTVNTTSGFRLSFNVANQQDAEDLTEALSGRASDVSNRLFGGLDRPEVLDLDVLRERGITLSGLTLVQPGLGTGGSAEVGPWGADAEMSRHNETYYDLAQQTRTDRTSWSFDGVGDGWNKDGASEAWTSEVVVDRDGAVVRVNVEKSVTAIADTRGGGEKLRDGLFGLLPVVDVSNTESTVVTNVTRWEFGPDSMPAGVRELAASDDRIGLLNLAPTHGADALEIRSSYSGVSESATRGGAIVIGGSSTTAYGDLDLVSAIYRDPGSGVWVRIK